MLVFRTKPQSRVSQAWVYLYCLLAIPLLGQQDAGAIVGTALDPAGAVIPGVTVSIINTATGSGREPPRCHDEIP